MSKDCRLLKLSDDFLMYKPVGYMLKGSLYIVNDSWGTLFASVVRHYLYRDIVTFKTLVSDGIFKRTVGFENEEVISNTTKGLKGAKNLGHGVYVATKGLKGVDVAYYLNNLINALSVDEQELSIIASKQNHKLTREEVKEYLLQNTIDESKEVEDIESIVDKLDDNSKTESNVELVSKVNAKYNELIINFEDVDISSDISKEGLLVLNIKSKEVSSDKTIALDNITNWCEYTPVAYKFKGTEFISVSSWDAVYLEVLRSYTVSTRDSDRLQALIDKGVFITYDSSLVSNKYIQSMRKPTPIGKGMYADNCFFNPNDMKNILMRLFSELGESFESLQIKVNKR